MIRPPALLAAAGLVAAGLAAPAAAQGTSFALPDGSPVQANVRSMTELRFVDMVRQSRDLSCGAAAIATVLTHFFGRETSEVEVIEAIFADATEETRAGIMAAGFSMLELKRHFETLGYVAGGFRVADVSDLASLTVPAITLVNVRGYNHFVVIRRLQDGHVLVADPAFGNLRIDAATFAGQWSGVILVAVDPRGAANPDFMNDRTVRARPRELVSIGGVARPASVRLPGEY